MNFQEVLIMGCGTDDYIYNITVWIQEFSGSE